MKPGPKARYRQLGRTTITTEQWRLDAIRIMRKSNPTITDSYIFNMGFSQVFETVTKQGNREKSILLEKFLENRKIELEELMQEVHELETLCSQSPTKQEEQMILVEDIEDKKLTYLIPASAFDPKKERRCEA